MLYGCVLRIIQLILPVGIQQHPVSIGVLIIDPINGRDASFLWSHVQDL